MSLSLVTSVSAYLQKLGKLVKHFLGLVGFFLIVYPLFILIILPIFWYGNRVALKKLKDAVDRIVQSGNKENIIQTRLQLQQSLGKLKQKPLLSLKRFILFRPVAIEALRFRNTMLEIYKTLQFAAAVQNNQLNEKARTEFNSNFHSLTHSKKAFDEELDEGDMSVYDTLYLGRDTKSD